MNSLPVRLLRWLVFVVASGLAVRALAGRTHLPRLWGFLAIYWVTALIGTLMLDPEMTRERLRWGQKTIDPAILAGLRATVISQLVVGILDIGRFHWSDTVPLALSLAGFAATVAAFAFALTAVRANRFFVPAVRIQSERGHKVVDTGPYRLVRHPGYAGMVVAAPAGGLALGSWLAFALGLTIAALFVLRAAGEDRFLRGNLEGYAEYSARTRFRLVPGIW